VLTVFFSFFCSFESYWCCFWSCIPLSSLPLPSRRRSRCLCQRRASADYFALWAVGRSVAVERAKRIHLAVLSRFHSPRFALMYCYISFLHSYLSVYLRSKDNRWKKHINRWSVIGIATLSLSLSLSSAVPCCCFYCLQKQTLVFFVCVCSLEKKF